MRRIKRLSSVICAVAVILSLALGINITDGFAAKKIKLNKTKLTLTEGKTYRLKVKNNKKKVKWSCNKKHVATVSSTGLVKAKNAGSVKVTAKVKSKKLYCKIVVNKKITNPSSNPNSNSNSNPSIDNKPSVPVTTGYTFRRPAYLTEHYQKHGIEMGFATENDYLVAANNVIKNPDALHKLEASDGDHVYYIELTNEIVFLSADGYIRTYFICSGKDYYDRQ